MRRGRNVVNKRFLKESLQHCRSKTEQKGVFKPTKIDEAQRVLYAFRILDRP